MLCHHPTAGDSGGHCRRSHPAMEEGIVQTGRAWHGICVALFAVCVICVQFFVGDS